MSDSVGDNDLHNLPHLEEAPRAGATDRFRSVVENSIGASFVGGNEVTVLRNGREIFPAMLEAIGTARRTIDFVTFVYWTGQVANDFAEALAARATAGVRVRVVLDAFGSAPMNKALVERLIASGAEVERFRPVVRWKLWESDHRTHRKILVVDDQVGFTGGVGIAEEWEGDARDPSEWRETHFRVEGPAVLGLKAAFLTDWRDCGHPLEAADVSAFAPPRPGDVELAVVDGSAQIGLNHAERVLEALVVSAEQRIVVQTPYLNPLPEMVDLLTGAACRGVAVDIVIPGPHLDKRIANVVAGEATASLRVAGVRVWRYQPTMMHVKAVLVDGVVALVGSVNLNGRSIEKDEEVALLVLDRAIVETLEGHAGVDIAHSRLADPRRDGLPLARRLAGWLLRPLRGEM